MVSSWDGEFLGEFLQSEYEQLKETATWAQGMIGCVFSVSDRRTEFEQLEYTDDDYQKELEHIEKVFVPLVEKCKKYGRAMGIGTNHGSLSDRIMSYFGDSPRGMVESAFEFARICRKLDFHNFVFSMKASNPVIMVQAYRLLVAEMYVQGWDYPLHLGVTDGEGEDGRMKSAIGIGTLLQDGLGDTIRVSLTEPPEEEIDPCRKLANLGMKASQILQGVVSP
ncbi:putative (E)-4-hydroxy-3-methylbut-2-enyl-diphosphate synthase (ferredoxin) [Helianthus annuus]|nr:putative (E)-4-hydroxy-3-methylbut-2-enyl-diphosphate synthase (ferredoxin) [Helianthus annuus]